MQQNGISEYRWLILLIAVLCLCNDEVIAQQGQGTFSLGMRSTFSYFEDAGTYPHPGMGTGEQFRIQLSDKINTEWFADLIRKKLDDLGSRKDYHIGWSVLYYPLPKPTERTILPYILAGHCFDYSKLQIFEYSGKTKRWSGAAQAGLGTHILVSPQFDIDLKAQYMIHLGKHLELPEPYDADNGHQHTHEVEPSSQHHGLGHFGHILLTIGVNYKIAHLW